MKLKNDKNELQDERKEMEVRIKELEEEIKRLKLKSIDTNEYEKWTRDELLFWILSLENGLFYQYESVLRKLFIDENIDGSCLNDMEPYDVQHWIQDFKARKKLWKHIQLITNKKKLNDNNQNDNEGVTTPTADI